MFARKQPIHITQRYAFDFDGVIADSLETMHRRVCDLLPTKLATLMQDRSVFLNCFEGNVYRKLRNMGLRRRDIAHLAGKLGTIAHESLNTVQPFPGAIRLLEAVAAQQELIIITSNHSDAVRTWLKRLSASLEVTVLGADVSTNKTKKLKRWRRRFRSAHCTYIGDTVGDLLECRKAKVDFIAANWGWHGHERLHAAGANQHAHNPSDLHQRVIGA